MLVLENCLNEKTSLSCSGIFVLKSENENCFQDQFLETDCHKQVSLSNLSVNSYNWLRL